jgi:hypothetical protein
MQRPIPKANAMHAIGANLARDQRDKEKADLIEVVRASALQIAALTELAVELDNRVRVLEAKG